MNTENSATNETIETYLDTEGTDNTTPNHELEHIKRAKIRLENLWANGTDYCKDVVRTAKEKNGMVHLDLDLTGECQLKCFYCDRTPDRFNEIPARRELNTEERKAVIRQARLLGATTVEFPGAGEPMIDAGFWEVVEYIHSQGMTTVLFTSGYHLDEAAVERLYDLGATVFLKYNTNVPNLSDQMVGVKGYFEKNQKAMRLLLKRGFNKSIPTRLAVDMVVTPKYHDVEQIKQIFRWCRRNNVHNYIMTLIPEGLADKKQLILERQRANELIAMLQEVDETEFGLMYNPSRPMAGGYRCRQVNIGMFVNLFGEVYDCNGLGRFIGHVRNSSLEDIWNAKFARHVREKDQNGFCLLRERVWAGVSTTGMQRKMDDYEEWRQSNGSDPVLESGYKYTIQQENH